MKKILAFAMWFVLLASAGCTNASDTTESPDTTQVPVTDTTRADSVIRNPDALSDPH